MYTQNQIFNLSEAKGNLSNIKSKEFDAVINLLESVESNIRYRKQIIVMRIYHFVRKLNPYFTLRHAWAYVNDYLSDLTFEEKYSKNYTNRVKNLSCEMRFKKAV